MFFFALIELVAVVSGVQFLSNKRISKEQMWTLFFISLIFSFITIWIEGVFLGALFSIFIAIYLYFRTSLKYKSVLWVATVVTTGVLSSHLSYLMLRTISFTIEIKIDEYHFFYDLLRSGISIIVIFITCLWIRRLLNRLKMKEKILSPYVRYVALMAFSVLISFYTVVIVLNDLELSIVNALGIAFSFVVLTSVIITVFLLSIRISKDDLKRETERVEQEQMLLYASQLESLYTVVHQKSHDYKNSLIAIQAFLIEQDYVGLGEYVNEGILLADTKLDAENRYIGLLGKLNNTALKGLIASKLTYAQEKDIKVTVEILAVISAWPVKSHDLVRMIGIILDNAIEECLNHEYGEIGVAIFTSTDYDEILITNTCCQKTLHPEKLKKHGFSTKGENRGIGLSNLSGIIDSYEMLSLETKHSEGIFSQKIRIGQKGMWIRDG